ncbi:MAG: glycosyltransferase family 2 protein, partial [Candidatus Dormibacteria bacterium]
MHSDGAKTTVLIPTRCMNEQLLRLAIASLRAQTIKAWCAIVIDNSQKRGQVVDIVASYEDTRLSYAQNDGPHDIGAVFNCGIDHVRTEFFCFLHDDDELEPNYLETMLRVAGEHPDASLYACTTTIINLEGGRIRPLGDEVKRLIAPRADTALLKAPGAFWRLAIGNYLFCPTLFYRFDRVSGRRFSLTHRFVLDLVYTTGVLLDGGTIVFINRNA